MGKKWWILAALLAVLGAGGLIWKARRPAEPVYNGRPISFWIKCLISTQNASKERLPQASQDLPNLDTNALPFLLKSLECRDGAFRRKYLSLFQRMPNRLQSVLPQPVPRAAVRASAVLWLTRMGAPAKPAVPKLIRASENDDNTLVRMLAVDGLAKIDRENPAVRDALIHATHDRSPAVSMEAITQLKGVYDMDVLPGSTRGF